MRKILALLSVTTVILFGCSKDKITGEGAVQTEVRNTTTFTKIACTGSTALVLDKGGSFKIEAKAYTNLLPYLETKVENGELTIGYKNGIRISNDNSKVFVIIPVLEKISVAGSGNAEIFGDFSNNPAFEAYTAGSGSISFHQGYVPSFRASVNGSGNIYAFGLTAERAEVTTEGSGNIETKVLYSLKATTKGSGSIFYKGDPGTISTYTLGSGHIVKI